MLTVKNLKLPHLDENTLPIDFELTNGQILGVIGPNACGKSTLLRSLCAIETPVAGDVFIGQRALHQLDGITRAQHVGLLSQEHHIGLNISVYETVLSGQYPYLNHNAQLTEEAVNHTLASIELFDLKDLQNRELSALSGGEKQRVYLALLYNQSPHIWLLDEPTNHLDLGHQIKLVSLLKDKSKNKTIICTLHDINVAAKLCTHLLAKTLDGRWHFAPAAELLNVKFLKQVYGVAFDQIDSKEGQIFMPVYGEAAID